MKDGHPVWIKETCLMCFGCLRLCPTAAIRYGDTEQSKCAIAKVS
jgi:Fe-S-cluster-containing hydrogenase component 2